MNTTAQIVIPSSDPIRHLFMPLTHQSNPTKKEVERNQSNIKEEISLQISSLTRSLQQQHVENKVSKNSLPITIQGFNAMANTQSTAVSYDPKLHTDAETVITILSSATNFGHTPLEVLTVSPSVSLPTASIVTVPSVATSAGMFTTSAITTPLSCTMLAEQSPQVPHPASEGSPYSITKKPLLSQTSFPATVAVASKDMENKPLEEPHSPLLGCPQQYIPSAAIPVPSVSPAHATSPSSSMEAVVPLARRTYHDFHGLETISEHGETTTDSPLAIGSCKEEGKEYDSEPAAELTM
jgi:hypothetical protein